jgi:hypothetical protein
MAPAGSASRAHALNHALRRIYPSKSVIPPTDLICLLDTDQVRGVHLHTAQVGTTSELQHADEDFPPMPCHR